MKKSPASVIVCIICFFSIWSVLGLSGLENAILWISKNAEFDADFESVEKVAKNLVRKKVIRGKVTEKSFLLLITLLIAEVFGLCGIFFGDSSNCAFYDTHIEFKKINKLGFKN